MTTLEPLTVRCAMCGETSEQVTCMSTSVWGAPDLDGRPAELARGTMPFWVQECPECGYCARSIDEAIAGARETMASPDYIQLRAESALPRLASRFLRLALIGDVIDAAGAAQARLHAAWACDDEEGEASANTARECRLRVAEALERMKPFPSSEEGEGMHRILIDVLRRAGEFERAAAECEALRTRSLQKATGTVVDFEGQLIALRRTERFTFKDAERALHVPSA